MLNVNILRHIARQQTGKYYALNISPWAINRRDRLTTKH